MKSLGLILVLSCAGAACAATPDGMVMVPAGVYTPLYKNEGKVNVPAFYLDVFPITNGEYLEFVRAHPEWSRSKAKHILADDSYLRGWAADLDLGANDAKSPVTSVSWFAARAYAKWKGKRLPTLAEWELAAAASETNAVGSDDPAYNQRILDWYSKPSSGVVRRVGSTFKNFWGVYDMHGLVWEWVSDFNTALVTGESRADTGLDRQLFCGSGSVGASDFRDYAAFMRYAFRSSLKANYTVPNLGFRCAKDVDEE